MNQSTFYKWIYPQFGDANFEKLYQSQIQKQYQTLSYIIAVGLILHYIYIIAIIFEANFDLVYIYILVLCIEPIFTILTILAIICKNQRRYNEVIYGIIISVNAVLWACMSLTTTIFCYTNNLDSHFCSNSTSRPVSLGLIFYNTFGVLISLLILKPNRLIFFITLITFDIFFICTYSITQSRPYLLILPTIGFHIFSIIFSGSLENLERSVYKLNSDLEKKLQQNLELQEQEQIANQSAKQLVNYVFHECRIILNTLILNWECDVETNETIDLDSKKTIKAGFQGLANILDDVLDIRKIQEGKFRISNKPFNFSNMLIDVKRTMQPGCDIKNINFGIQIDPRLNKSIIGDESRLRQVISNYVSNAIKFTPFFGHIQITSKLVKENESNVTVLVEVKDTGAGISEENQKKLFKNFSQLTEQTNQKGTGLGLAIVSSLVKSFGGKFGVRSSCDPLDHGSTFWFLINLQIDPSSFSKKISVSNSVSKSFINDETPIYIPKFHDNNDVLNKNEEDEIKNKNNDICILVVDDDEVTRKIMKKTLANIGFHNCILASDGLDALNHINRTKFNLIITDGQMPNMDGFDLTKTIRTQGYSMPICIITGSISNLGEESKYIVAGANTCLTKPINKLKLQRICESLIKL